MSKKSYCAPPYEQITQPHQRPGSVPADLVRCGCALKLLVKSSLLMVGTQSQIPSFSVCARSHTYVHTCSKHHSNHLIEKNLGKPKCLASFPALLWILFVTDGASRDCCKKDYLTLSTIKLHSQLLIMLRFSALWAKNSHNIICFFWKDAIEMIQLPPRTKWGQKTHYFDCGEK